MDKEKQIEEMLKNSSYCSHTSSCFNCLKCREYRLCEKLINAGYGDIKVAVRKFAEKLKEKIEPFTREDETFDFVVGLAVMKEWVLDCINELLKEYADNFHYLQCKEKTL